MGIETEEEDQEIGVNKIMEELIPAITLKEIKDATSNDAELGPILESKQRNGKTTDQSKGIYGKIWDETHERDSLLIRNKQLIIPKTLQAQAIALAHEGHQQMDGTPILVLKIHLKTDTSTHLLFQKINCTF